MRRLRYWRARSSGHGCRAERSRPTPCGFSLNLCNFLRTLATPEPIKDWSLTSLKEKLIKIGAKVVSHGRYVVFQMAEVAITRQMFQEIPGLSRNYGRSHHPRQHEAFDCRAFKSNRQEECVQGPKIWD
jgi:Transposase DDE domain group 1